MVKKALLILKTGSLPVTMTAKYGDYDTLYPRMAGLDADDTICVDIARGEEPDTPTSYCGAIVSGSEALVTEHAPWSEKAAEWLRGAVSAELPVLGICYGHQLLAYALGGAVGFHPDGMELGTVTVTLSERTRDHPWLHDIAGIFSANVIHSQAVSAVPSGATVLGRSAREMRQMISFTPTALGVQFHPEFDGEIMTDYLSHLARREPSLAALCATRMRRVGDTPASRMILQNFAAFVTERAR